MEFLFLPIDEQNQQRDSGNLVLCMSWVIVVGIESLQSEIREHHRMNHPELFKKSSQIKFDRQLPLKHQPNQSSIKYKIDRDRFVNNLLRKMSITEKIGQMTQLDIGTITKPNSASLNYTQLDYLTKTFNIGSFLNSPVSQGTVDNGTIYTLNTTTWMNLIKDIQTYSIKNSPNKIPMIYGLDSVHGANYIHKGTLFPHNTGLAATFNPALATKVGSVTAKDTTAVGIPWIFAPVLDLGINPLWSRIYETFGEDPHVAATMGSAVIRGLQGNQDPFNGHIESPYGVGSAKHFFGYSNPKSGKDRTPAWIPEIMMRRYFLPSFAAGVNEGIGTVMVNSGEINGRPMHATRKYLTDLLQDELEFEGVIVTDWEDIIKLCYFHHIASNPYEAISIALDAGIDMSMVPSDTSFPTYLREMVLAGIVPEHRLDRSVRKILNLKYSLGLFKNPFPDPNNPYLKTVGSAEDRALAASIVEESIVLLQNHNNTLPLSKTIGSILVTGPSANNLTNLNGGWSIHWQGALNDSEFPFGTTILKGFKQTLNNTQVKVEYKVGAMFGSSNEPLLKEAADASSTADATIVVIGELPEAETPGDINDLTMDPSNTALLEAILDNAKGPVILVIVESRPRVIDPKLVARCSAVLMAFLPGSEGGKPIADIVFGNVNPSGRMPLTYPAYTGDIGVTYFHKFSESLATSPLFEFGQVDLEPGNSTFVKFRLALADFSYISEDLMVTIDSGLFQIAIGTIQMNLILE
ncbi:beta glucosidase [Heterostelium album PN500]|uniref:beta-glucosidase n=1 Tax=Heterostelium pallidum (strain ATCC 26659 / Pp 5 / PN500) TaxID=670386 RepID=D3B0Y5_HETP5|nr:beta glucosidase [Heterostelium album PN500]EFA84959.1 beta glucosidase [Heterostelium album PN500]|eukprot:XP_020437069.1 beta glucosidase [Heterostelium album PN500]